MSIRLYNNSGGYIDLNAGGTGSAANTFTLPAETGTILTTASTFAGTGPSFSAYRSGTQSVSSSVFTKIEFNVEDWDTNSNYDNSTNYRFTPNVAGYYHVSLSVSWSFTSGISLPAIYKNGSVWKYGALQGATGAGCLGTTTALVYLNGTTDYIEAYVYQNNGTNNIATSSVETYFQAALVRAA
jgi:hypothetical protein